MIALPPKDNAPITPGGHFELSSISSSAFTSKKEDQFKVIKYAGDSRIKRP